MRPLRSITIAALLLSACAEAPPRPAGSAGDSWEAPRRRTEGPRSIPFAGGDPTTKGWTRVDGFLWVETEHASAYARGLLRSGDRYATVAEADALEKSPAEGYALRTDHVLLHTDVAFARAKDLARLAEAHVGAVLRAFGDPLDLRLPADPLRIVVAARRDGYAALLRRRVASEVSWNAFYEAADGTVYACDERGKDGGLPVVLDLKHELVHAILDLGRSDAGRASLFTRPQFWAWEAAAVWAEGFVDSAPKGQPPTGESVERLARWKRRRAFSEVTPLPELFALRQDSFLGRHYDETASFMVWLMAAESGRFRKGFFALLVQVMEGWGEVDSFERYVGLTPEDAQRRWLASLDAAR